VSPLSPEEVGLHTLTPKPGARKQRRRVGRGEGSGRGKQSGRGHKGAGARSGSKRKTGHEGGQNPIHMRTRKLRGPHRKMSMPFEPFRTRTQPVNVGDLEARFDAGAQVTPETLRAAGLVKRRDAIKLLGRGELKKKLTVKVHAYSATAREKVEGAGGTCEELSAASPAAPASGASRRITGRPSGSPAEEAAG
jgi:large subunit ribosomal protein L15